MHGKRRYKSYKWFIWWVGQTALFLCLIWPANLLVAQPENTSPPLHQEETLTTRTSEQLMATTRPVAREFRLAALSTDEVKAARNQVKFGKVGTTQTVVLKVTDEEGQPLAGVTLSPVVIREPEGVTQPMRLYPTTAVTDASGIARFQLLPGDKAGRYDVLFFRGGEPSGEIAFTRLEFVAQDSNWATMLILSLAGGLAIFLYGMKIASEGLQIFGGNRLRSSLGDMTKSPLRALGLGFALTTLTQSSGATTVMLMSFVRAKLLSFRNSLGVILGAAIAGTLTVQLISLNLFSYALPAIAVGFAISFSSKAPRPRAVGNSLMGFGFVFFGIKIMTDTMAPLKSFPFFADAVKALGEHPVWSVILSMLFTAAAQNSGATVGIVLSLTRQELISLEEAIPMFLGAAIGASFTGLTAAIGAPAEAKRVAVAHLIYKVVGTILFLPLVRPLADVGMALTKFLMFHPESAPLPDIAARAVANTYTLYMIITAALTLLVLPWLEKLCVKLIPETGEVGDWDVRTKYLDLRIVDTPVVALGSARREISRMGRFVEEMMKAFGKALFDRDEQSLDFIRQRDRKVDALNAEITRFLAALTRKTMNDKEISEATALLFIVSDLESVGDIIDKNLVPLAAKMIVQGREFSTEGKEDLMALHAAVSERLSQTIIALTTNTQELAENVIAGFDKLQEEGKLLHARHLKRLRDNIHVSLESSSVHLDVINYLLRIDYLVYDICLHIVGRAKAQSLTDV
ncbi:Sodium-dependent phosphate transporter [Candidatus Sumerlaea chitinivorans]|uniref:Sodium-dependent phosphate transporter n=1 Tax=Sumerlaea chitinivorans TaxID=2250252 RepID=A0A2Z4Y3R5_SUMC1|nr:Sodium-dependent phosphate transporter [Candidatus Sumerlaea chitinivorans]